jgi:hypothetical protein
LFIHRFSAPFFVYRWMYLTTFLLPGFFSISSSLIFAKDYAAPLWGYGAMGYSEMSL